jgi:hypothetical protein
MTPYILLGRKKLPNENSPSSLQQVYDEHRQIWIDTTLGAPLVSCLQNHIQPTRFGETTFTRTQEGTDQTEGTVQASRFGETVHTKTREGIDQTEITAIEATQLCDTMTRIQEGADRLEGQSLEEFDAPYSHF